jgi:predicted transcriptional regulator
MPQATTPLSLRLDPAVRDRLWHEAQIQDRSISYVAQKAIIDFLDAKDSKRQAILTAIAEADKGEFISDEAMIDWANSWGGDNELPIPNSDISP